MESTYPAQVAVRFVAVLTILSLFASAFPASVFVANAQTETVTTEETVPEEIIEEVVVEVSTTSVPEVARVYMSEESPIEEPAPRCVNLLQNASFEDPVVTNASLWDKFASVPSWIISAVSGGPTTLEIMRGWNGNTAADGAQYAELDGDLSTKITQNAATLEGGSYQLKWSFGARSGIAPEQNQLSVMVNGIEVETEGPLSDTGALTLTEWVRGSHSFVATGTSTEISFADKGASDSYGTFLDDAELCLVTPPAPKTTIVAEKIICDSEASLPNWGNGGANITSNTAADFVAEHPGCRLASDWQFEWASNHVANPGDDLVGTAGGAWTTFGPTDGTGKTSVSMKTGDLANGKISLREVLQSDYIPFTYLENGNNSDNVTAEFYCGNDVQNYDNLEYLTVGSDTYHCVAFNVMKEVPAQCELVINSDTTTVVDESNTRAVATYTHGAWTASIPGATWIWDVATVTDPVNDTTRTFIETFTVATPTSATLEIAADNGYQVYLNGVLVSDKLAIERNFGTATSLPLMLQNGANELKIVVKNFALAGATYQSNPAGVLFKLTAVGSSNCVRTTTPDPVIDPEPEPDMYVVSGYKYECNEDGEWYCNNELAGWEITITNGSTTLSTTTNANGYYEFKVPAGQWTVSEEERDDWYQVMVEQNGRPLEDATACTFEFGKKAVVLDMFTTVAPYIPLLTPIVDSNTCDFGNAEREYEESYYTISGYKWNDVDGDGFWDDSEQGLPNWVITATNGEDELTATTTESGYYSFRVPMGAWSVSETQQTGWTQTGLREYGESVDEGSNCTFLVGYKPMYEESAFARSEMSSRYTCDFGNQQQVVTTPTDDSSPRTGTRTRGGNRPQGQVLGATTQCGLYLNDYMQAATENNPYQVMKLQVFLTLQGFFTPLTMVFDATTTANVKKFQEKYASEIITPWYERGIVPHTRPTGFVYKTTRWKINDIMCPGIEAYPSFDGETLTANVVIPVR